MGKSIGWDMVVVELGVALEVAGIALAESIGFFDDKHVLLIRLAVYLDPLGNQVCRYCYLFLLFFDLLHQIFCEYFSDPIAVAPKSFDVLTFNELIHIDSLHVSLCRFD